MGLFTADYGLLVNGRPLSDYGVYVDHDGVELREAKPATSYAQVPGQGGSHDLTLADSCGDAWTGRRTLVIHLGVAATGQDAAALVTGAKRAVGALNGSQVRVWWQALGGWLRGRASVDGWDDNLSALDSAPHSSHGRLLVEAMPWVYGAPEVVSLAEGDNAIVVDGNRPCRPVLKVTPSAQAASWSVSFCGATVEVVKASPSSVLTATLDYGRRRIWHETSGDNVVPTLESDFGELAPGEQTVALEGCSATMTYEPLWMI